MGESGRAVCRIQHEKIAIQFIQAFKMRRSPFDSAPGKDRSNWEGNADAAGLQHLEKHPEHDGIMLVLEPFLADFVSACARC